MLKHQSTVHTDTSSLVPLADCDSDSTMPAHGAEAPPRALPRPAALSTHRQKTSPLPLQIDTSISLKPPQPTSARPRSSQAGAIAQSNPGSPPSRIRIRQFISQDKVQETKQHTVHPAYTSRLISPSSTKSTTLVDISRQNRSVRSERTTSPHQRYSRDPAYSHQTNCSSKFESTDRDAAIVPRKETKDQERLH